MRGTRALIVVIALTALSACDAAEDDGSGAKVASLVSAAPSASASPGSPRPRYRFDMTAEDEKALWVPYNRCLEEHGYTRVDAKKAEDARARGASGGGKKAAELRECEEKYLPLPEWEKDPANPRAGDFARAVAKCLKAKGIKMEGDEIADSEDVATALDASGDCEREVAASRY
ncbi:hypothetical protein [Actinoplanes sp. NPDC049316]|uniref:hypothetical protein n=1 Tax=Actinoplanes sp. NPDC049316 TaxID=3154727 RepID=UPI003431B82E